MTWLGRDALGRVTDFSAETTTTDSNDPPDITVGGGAVEQAVLSRTVTLTDAQIKALPTTLVEVVPAPSAGQVLIPLAAVLALDTTAGAYTGADDACFFQIVYGDNDNDATNITDNQTTDDALESAAEQPWWLTPDIPGSGVAGDLFLSIGAPLKVLLSNSSTPLGGGNAANTLKVTVVYTVVDL